MAHIEFLDETMRDGQQSLWGMRMQAGMALPVSPIVDRTGYRVIDLTGSSMFECLIKYCHENPWEGLDLLVNSMPRTRIRGGMRSNASVTFGVTPDSLMDAWMRQLNVHGVRSYWVYDVLFNNDKTKRLAKIAKEFGSEVAGAIMFTLSPVHTDAYYAKQADELSACDDIDTLLLYDTAGVLEKERLSTLVPAIREKARGKPIEFHSNNLLGQSAKAYLDAVELEGLVAAGRGAAGQRAQGQQHAGEDRPGLVGRRGAHHLAQGFGHLGALERHRVGIRFGLGRIVAERQRTDREL